jgi:hypothetical protein
MPAFYVVVFVLGLLLFGTAAFIAVYLLWVSSEKRAYKEPRTIICPENLDSVEVKIDGEIAARSALEGREEFRITSCSRWPEKQGCDQECADQVPLVGDDRSDGQYLAFGMTPEQLRSESPVRMSPHMFGQVMRQKVNRYLHKKSA